MAWYNPFTWSWVLGGVDLEAEQRRRAELEAWEKRLDEQARKSVWADPGTWQTVQTQRAAEAEAYGSARDYAAEVTRAAQEGAIEGLERMQRGVTGALDTAAGYSLRAVLGFVPWWVWLGAAVYGAWRLRLFRR